VSVVTALRPLSLDEPLLDVTSAAELLNVRVSWIREATRTGYLPCLKVGKHVRYTRSMLEAWLAEQRADGRRTA
jgi:excisionase family DNA binding protein